MKTLHGQLDNNMDFLQPMSWDKMPDQQIVSTYSQMLSQSPDLHSSMDYTSTTSPSSDDSSPRAVRRKTSVATTDGGTATTSKAEKRREQNRQSQRAYRDRKEKHQRVLEGQIDLWKQKHDKLSKSFIAQTEELSRLKAQVEELNSKLTSLQSGLPETWAWTDVSPPDFNLVPFFDDSAGI